jgi:hypothetical protein
LGKFNRLPFKKLVKTLVLARLCAEYLVIICLGPILFPDKVVLEDKVEGRRELISFCFRNY